MSDDELDSAGRVFTRATNITSLIKPLLNQPHQQSSSSAPDITPPTAHTLHGPPREDPRSLAPAPAPQQYPEQTPVSSLTQLYTRLESTPIPRNHFMKPGDIKFVVSRIMLPLETMDPYHDDQYYLQYLIKSHRQQLISNASASGPLTVPAPLWKDAKDRVIKAIKEQRARLHDSKTWAKDEDEGEASKTLGTLVKSDVFRPREMISMSSLHNSSNNNNDDDNDEEDDDDDDFGDVALARTPFQSKLWSVRVAVQRGYEALLTVQELQHLLGTYTHSGVTADTYVEILAEMDRAVAVLCRSLGINTVHRSDALSPEVMLDGALLTALVQAAKGKKLLSRSMAFLTPQQRWAVIPAILAKVLQVPPDTQSAEDCAVEVKLLTLIGDFVEHSRQFQREQHQLAVLAKLPCAPFSVELLENLRKCIKVMMVSLMQKAQLKKALKSRRERAVTVNAIVEAGSGISYDVDEHSREEWVAVRDAFMTMLETAGGA